MNVEELTSQDQASQGSYRIHQNPANYLVESKQICGPSDVSAVSQTGSSKNKGIFIGEVTSDVSSSKASQPDEVRGYWTPHSTSESAASYLQALQISSSISSQGPMCGPGTLAPGTHVLAGPGSNMNPEPHGSTSENYAEQGSDTLCGDFGNYWINLQYARLCHNAQSEGRRLYPHSVTPPFYFRDNRLRKKSSNFMNMMAHGAPVVAEMQNQHGNRPIGFSLPRITEGTGAFLPNPSSLTGYFEVNI